MSDFGRTSPVERPGGPRRPGTHLAYLALGANLGARMAHLQHAVDRLAEAPAVRELVVSPVYESEAHTPKRTERESETDEHAPDFLNAVVRLRTSWTPLQLLEYAQLIEREAGRRREKEGRWEPRRLDVDLLVVGGLTCRTPRLTIPHPRLGERRFVLRPLVDVDPTMHVPEPFDAPAEVLLRRCSDSHALRPWHEAIRVPGSKGPESAAPTASDAASR